MALFLIDGRKFDVGIESLERSAEIREGSASGVALSGRRIRDIKGVYYDYSLTISTDGLSPAEYDALYETITAPVESHTVSVPYGQSTLVYEAYITGAFDTLESSAENGENLWGGLAFTFTAMEPKRR
ncbi:MAG: hypothetical protein RSB55_02260, partial [Oscillospiraceae bacterium]